MNDVGFDAITEQFVEVITGGMCENKRVHIENALEPRNPMPLD